MTIGTLGEKSLHAALKAWYRGPQDQCEVDVEGYVIDIVHEDLFIEIQTRNFGSLKPKLHTLLENHRLHLVHPIAQEKWIVRQEPDGREVSRRKSPRKGNVYHLFAELVYLPMPIAHPNFSLEVVLIEEEEILLNDGQGSWRRKRWSIGDRRLLGVREQIIFYTLDDLARLLPPEMPETFTNRELAESIGQPMRLVQKMTYCLRALEVLVPVGKRGNALLYTRQL